MKKVHIWAIAVFILAIIGAIATAALLGERSPIIAAGTIEITDELVGDAKGLSELFIIVYDEKSQQPMPYGALRYRLDTPPEGEFFTFVITPDNLQRMIPDAPIPESIRLKARLDVDGRAGLDQPGDLVGEISQTASGSSGVSLKIDRKI